MLKKEAKDYKKLAVTLRKTADILDEIVENLENESIKKEEREEKNDELMGKVIWQLMKIKSYEN